ncbi:AmpG family muropeptide MFS transporter [Solemya velesiana gill symbiont]|uniref:MFS transporter n=1 Tax=Solemya velesiana gill symbiont TaxID=1918948 RepID=A0A1T2KX93_9GAMM|nr:MFS transporter [Solemya velesiana gill symbiont]OOZ37411.1 MFS transporter [Solemya velesiana gill symbiont]
MVSREEDGNNLSWGGTLKAYGHPRVVTMLFLGFSAGLPLLLIFSTLSLWLRDAEVSRTTVTYFSWAALGYSFKFIWAPIIDKMPLPVLSALIGRRRAWLLAAQLMVIAAITWMAFTDPSSNLTAMALGAVLLGFSGATQDIVIDAYRIESADQRLQTLMSSSYIAGYRIGMLVAGAGALKLASYFGADGGYDYQAWQWAYLCMAAAMGVGVLTTLVIREPAGEPEPSRYFNSLDHYLRFLVLFLMAVTVFVGLFVHLGEQGEEIKRALSGLVMINSLLTGFLVESLRLLLALAGAYYVARLAVRLGIGNRDMLRETYVAPLTNFFRRYGKAALLILVLIGVYRISDIVLGVISNVFYQDLGFSKDQIADITKTFGLIMTIVGGFLGGALALRYGVMRILMLGALLSAGTNLLFLLLSQAGADLYLLILVITADNLSAGLASAAFVAYLSGLTHISFTAFQYAMFSSLMTLFPKLLGGYSGSIVDAVGYDTFFVITTLLGLPVIYLVYRARSSGMRAVESSG